MKKIFLAIIVLFLCYKINAMNSIDKIGEMNEQKCLQAIENGKYSEAYRFFLSHLEDNDYFLNTPLSRNVYWKLRKHHLIDDYILDEEFNVSEETKKCLTSIQEEKFIDVFKEIGDMLERIQ